MMKQSLTWVFALVLGLAVPVSGAMADGSPDQSTGSGNTEDNDNSPSGDNGDQGGAESTGNAGGGLGNDTAGQATKDAGQIRTPIEKDPGF